VAKITQFPTDGATRLLRALETSANTGRSRRARHEGRERRRSASPSIAGFHSPTSQLTAGWSPIAIAKPCGRRCWTRSRRRYEAQFAREGWRMSAFAEQTGHWQVTDDALDELARKVNGRINNPIRDALAFPCTACGKLALASWSDGPLIFTRSDGCQHDVGAAFNAAFTPAVKSASASPNGADHQSEANGNGSSPTAKVPEGPVCAHDSGTPSEAASQASPGMRAAPAQSDQDGDDDHRDHDSVQPAGASHHNHTANPNGNRGFDGHARHQTASRPEWREWRGRVAAAALQRCPAILQEWLPGGRVKGGEFEAGNINGASGHSLKINLDKGSWKDFASDEPGGRDLISLYQRVRGLEWREAQNELAERFGIERPKSVKLVSDSWDVVTPVPLCAT
jgi:hypothetical protein